MVGLSLLMMELQNTKDVLELGGDNKRLVITHKQRGRGARHGSSAEEMDICSHHMTQVSSLAIITAGNSLGMPGNEGKPI